MAVHAALEPPGGDERRFLAAVRNGTERKGLRLEVGSGGWGTSCTYSLQLFPMEPFWNQDASQGIKLYFLTMYNNQRSRYNFESSQWVDSDASRFLRTVCGSRLLYSKSVTAILVVELSIIIMFKTRTRFCTLHELALAP